MNKNDTNNKQYHIDSSKQTKSNAIKQTIQAMCAARGASMSGQG